jgi:hypothetical protein
VGRKKTYGLRLDDRATSTVPTSTVPHETYHGKEEILPEDMENRRSADARFHIPQDQDLRDLGIAFVRWMGEGLTALVAMALYSGRGRRGKLTSSN